MASIDTDLEEALQKKLQKSHAKKEAKAKEARFLKHEEEVKMIEEKKFEKEMEREDTKIAEDVAKFSSAELEANANTFLSTYESLLAGRRLQKEKKQMSEKKAKLSMVPNPIRDWRCNGCNKTNTVAPGLKNKKKKKKKAAEDSDDDSDSVDSEAEKDNQKQPITRCYYCGVPHTYIPRGKRGAMVLAANALEATYIALNGDEWTHHKGWIKASRLSGWHGITADDETDRGSGAVLKVDLPDNNLKGELPPQLFRLTTLTHLLLDQNAISGQIPDDICNLSELKFIDLGGCKLTGPLPIDMCDNFPNLKSLALAGNKLSGAIPDNVSRLESLRSLWLQDNKLCGAIPAIGTLDELHHMDVSNNSLGGDLPYDIHGCKELERFDASHNFLTGKLPAAFGQLSNLTDLNLSNNSLIGPITMLTQLKKLAILNVSSNKFDGKLPNFESLYFLSEAKLNNNHFGGPLDESITTLEKLTILELQDNYMNGDVPAGIKKLKHLTLINLTNNKFDRYSLAECRISLEKHLPKCVRHI